MAKLTIDPELQDWLPGVPDQSYAVLEADLLEHGCQDSIKVWKGQDIIIDGHRRYEICCKHKIPYTLCYLEFASKDDVKYWMDCFQAGRRNLQGKSFTDVVTRLAHALEAKKKAKELDPDTRVVAVVAEKLGTTERQVYRAMEVNKSLMKLPEDLRKRIVSGEVKAGASTVKKLAGHNEVEQRAIFRDYDQRQSDPSFTKEEQTLRHVVNGDPEPGDEEQDDTPIVAPKVRKPTKPAPDLAKEAIDRLGQLAKTVDLLHSATPDKQLMAQFTGLKKQISGVLQKWGK